jgi:ATP-dependent helicase/nuclease subunit A
LGASAEVRRYFRRSYTHLLVDEFQDTDPVQAEVMLYLTASNPHERDWRACRPVPGALFVVGDPKQSIYRFRRADIATYNQVKQIIRDSGGDVVELTTNFRTTEPLVAWCNGVFGRKLSATGDRYGPQATHMDAGRVGVVSGELAGIGVIAVPDTLSEGDTVTRYDAVRIAHFIRRALDQGWTVPRSEKERKSGKSDRAEPEDFLIITRNKKELALYGRELQELRVPHVVSGGSALGQVSELQLLLDCLVAVLEPENPVAMVAALRGGLFGLSDAALYRYRRAGGTFSYRRPPPGKLDATLQEVFRDAFARMRRYHRWLKRLPVVPALERMASDLGLIVAALAQPGGNVLAGSLAKSFEILRAPGGGIHSASDAVARLRELIEGVDEFDSLPARADDGNVVRVMNLHKAKGLEAPVVFLANPAGKRHPTVELHVNRDGMQSRGYMAVHGSSTGWHAPLLACPADWDTFAEEERKFMEAESIRLLYVAATRAGTQLVITRRAKGRHLNPWQPFDTDVEGRAELEDPGAQRVPAPEGFVLDDGDVDRALEAIDLRWRSALTPTYTMAAAKEMLQSPSRRRSGPPGGEHGTEWGSVIHTLLETAMREPDCDLEPLARTHLDEYGLEPSRATEAVQTVVSVQQSDIWRRARAAEQVLVEVPFARWLDAADELAPADAASARSVPKFLRGVIDLVFREADGWVIVDYKTDQVHSAGLAELLEHYRGQMQVYAESWRQMTGEPVKESGLYLVRLGQYRRLS